MAAAPDATSRSNHDALPWRWFGVWLVLGAAYALALLGALTIGVFVLPVAVGGTLFAWSRRPTRVGLPGLVSGLGVPVLSVAYLNRDGPGTVCVALRGGGERCTEQWSPWPWIGVGVALLLVGAAVFSNRRRQLGAPAHRGDVGRGREKQ